MMDKDEKIYQFKCPFCLGVFIHKVQPCEMDNKDGDEIITATCPMCTFTANYFIANRGVLTVDRK